MEAHWSAHSTVIQMTMAVRSFVRLCTREQFEKVELNWAPRTTQPKLGIRENPGKLKMGVIIGNFKYDNGHITH